jgi:excinuclease ABC subunit C
VSSDKITAPPNAPACETRLAEKLKSLPARPGVYLMKDGRDRILYVGKAKVLRNRVRSYFQKLDARTQPKVSALVQRIRDFDYVVTASEVEALILEGNLIKQHKPRYNVLLKDDKTFPFIKVTDEPFPQVVVTRKILKDGARYFGPYTNGKAMRRTLELIRKVFPLRTCTNAKLWPSLDRPCLDYYIHRCPGPCKGHIGREGYEEIVQQVCQFLSGKKKDLVHQLKERMAQASHNLQFELAARIRDQIAAIDGAVIRQHVMTYEEVDRDVIGYARDGTDVCMAVLQVREGKLLGKEHFFMTAPEETPEAETLSAFMTQYYMTAQLLPREILLPCEPDDADALTQWLGVQAGVKIALAVPQRGDKAALVRMAAQNAELQLSAHALKKAETRERMSVPPAVQALQEDLKLPHPPRRIETFDISNIQGSDPVASMVCFTDGRPRKSEYRKFGIKEVVGPNDFAMLREVVGRRYRRLLDEEGPLPDLVLIDGGKGQLSSAKEVLDELGLVDLPVIGLAKRLEEVFLPDEPEPVLIPKTSPSLKLLMQARDEAHRFALTFHRERRGRRMVRSELDGIPGIGPKRKQTLLKVFGSVERLRDAGLDEIAAVEGIGRDAAEKVYGHLHK